MNNYWQKHGRNHTQQNAKTDRQRGQGIVEYLIIISLVGLAVIVTINVLEPALEDFFARFVGEANMAPPSLAGYTPPPTATPSNTPDPNASPTPSPQPSFTPTNTIEPTATQTVAPSATSENTATPTATETPAFAACEFEETGGNVVIEAEHYVNQTTSGSSIWQETAGYSNYVGLGAMAAIPNTGVNTGASTNGPRLNYSVRITNPGTYYVYVRGQAMSDPGASSNDSIHIGVNGTAVTNSSGTGLTGYDDSGFQWQSRWNNNRTIVSFSQPGTYTINVWMREDGIVIDRLWLSTNSNAVSDGSGSNGPGESNAPAGCTGTAPPTPTPVACYDLAAGVSPANSGTISINPGPNCAGGRYTAGTSVTLEAAPAGGYLFSEWSGSISSLNSTINVTMNADQTLTANFATEPVILVNASFNNDSEGFSYSDDTFRNTNEPGYARGRYDSNDGNPPGSLRVNLGGVDTDKVDNMSGGWQTTFTLNSATAVSISFDYQMIQDNEYENNEYVQVLMSVDGTLYGTNGNDYITELSGGGDTGMENVTITTGVLSAGSHTLTIGGYNNRKTYDNEETEIYIDNVYVEAN